MLQEEFPLNISVTFRQTEPTEALKNYATEKLTQLLRKYVHCAADAKVILTVQKRDHSAEIIVHSRGYDASATATTVDLYSAIDKVMDSIGNQLRKQKEKIVDRHKHQDVHS